MIDSHGLLVRYSHATLASYGDGSGWERIPVHHCPADDLYRHLLLRLALDKYVEAELEDESSPHFCRLPSFPPELKVYEVSGGVESVRDDSVLFTHFRRRLADVLARATVRSRDAGK